MAPPRGQLKKTLHSRRGCVEGFKGPREPLWQVLRQRHQVQVKQLDELLVQVPRLAAGVCAILRPPTGPPAASQPDRESASPRASAHEGSPAPRLRADLDNDRVEAPALQLAQAADEGARLMNAGSAARAAHMRARARRLAGVRERCCAFPSAAGN